MAYNLTVDLNKINEIKFSYQVGIVKTTIPWNRPTYDAIKKFLRDDIVQSVLKKYNAYIIGAILWDISKTWDIDIFLKNKDGNHPNTLEEFIILENDLHILYDIALNKYSILVDIHYRTGSHKLPTKQELIEYNFGNFEKMNEWIYPQDISLLYRIGYTKKVVGDSVSETILYNAEFFPLNEKLTNSYLTKVVIKYPLKSKIINRIMNSSKEVLTSYFTVEEYLSMDINGPTNF
jgi:hypothetical protein